MSQYIIVGIWRCTSDQLIQSRCAGHLSGIYFTNANVGYCIGGSTSANTSTILKTIDGGFSWTEQPTSANSLTKIHFLDDIHAYCVGYSGTVLKGN